MLLLLAVLLMFCLRPIQAADGAAGLQAARQALTGEHKDVDKARNLLLEVVQGGDTAGDHETLFWAYTYLGYMEDRSGNRQSAIEWYQKAVSVDGVGPGSLSVAKLGLEKPLVWIRHLDSPDPRDAWIAKEQAPDKTPEPAPFEPKTSEPLAPTPPGRVRVLITPLNGEPALAKDQLTVSIDKKRATIEDVVPAKGEPLVFALLLDTSKSSHDNEAFERQSALTVIRTLAAGPNTAFFGDFSDELHFAQKPTSLESVEKELNDMGRFRGATALYDAILAAARLVNREATGTNRRRAVLVLTDGNDNASHVRLNQLIPALQWEGVPVFCIGLMGEALPDKAPAALVTISKSTGGVPYLLPRSTNFLPLLLAELENQHWLTLELPAGSHGTMHSLAIKNHNKKSGLAFPGAVLVP